MVPPTTDDGGMVVGGLFKIRPLPPTSPPVRPGMELGKKMDFNPALLLLLLPLPPSEDGIELLVP